MVNDRNIVKAINSIDQRSERGTDEQRLVASFVDSGIIDVLCNRNSQLMFGRRGTGKTHVLKVLGHEMSLDKYLPIYIDCRTLGSTTSIFDLNLSPIIRAIHLFNDMLCIVHRYLMEYYLTNDFSDSEILTLLDQLLDEFKSFEKHYTRIVSRQKQALSEQAKNDMGLAFSTQGPQLNMGNEDITGFQQEHESETEYQLQESIVFPNLSVALSKILEKLNIQILLLIDEWSGIPKDMQPIMAEYIKRSFLICNAVTVKIAAIEYHTQLLLDHYKGSTQRVGIEIGADIADAVNLDEFYVYDLNRPHVIDYFSEVLYKHLSLELPNSYLADKHNIHNSKALVAKLFTQKSVFDELARSCEGVTRDFINILSRSIIKARQGGAEKIDKKTIMSAAGEWFERDKLPQLSEECQDLLADIIDEVIGGKQARAFMVEQRLSNHIGLQSLYDFRVVHLIHKGYSNRDKPGRRYNIFVLDYGTYVEMLKTHNWNQQLSFFIPIEELDKANMDTVPYDDKRSIRQIVLGEAILNKHFSNRAARQ